MNTITSHSIALILGGAIVAGVCGFNTLKKSLPSIPSPPSKDLAKVDKEILKCLPVVVYKDRAKDKLGLPTAVVADTEQRVLGATQVKPNERPTTVSAVLNIVNGETAFYQRLDPLPWLAFNRRATLGVAYGFKNDHDGAAIRVYGKLELLKIKALKAGLMGDVDNARGWFGGGYAEASSY